MDKKSFAQGIALLKAAKLKGDDKFSEATRELWWKMLKDIPSESFEKSIVEIIKTFTYFPTIAEIREKAGINKDKTLEAWVMVENAMYDVGLYQSVKFTDPVIHSVISALGGWVEMNTHEEKELKWVKKEFLELYKLLESKEDHMEYLPGFTESHNYARGYDIPKPVLIGGEKKKALPRPVECVSENPGKIIPKEEVIELCRQVAESM